MFNAENAVDITLRPSPFPIPRSKAKEMWEQMKANYGVESKSMDAVMEMFGLEEGKIRLVEIAFKITLARINKGAIPLPEELTIIFRGNPGLGKATIAKHYVEFLYDFEVNKRPPNQLAVRMLPLPNLTSASFSEYQGSACVIVNGPPKSFAEIQKRSRNCFKDPRFTVNLQDFTEYELYHFFVKELSSRFEGRIACEGFSINGVPTKALIKRVAKGRGTPTFKNRHSIEDLVQDIISRQNVRLLVEGNNREYAKYRVLTQEDLLGPNPSQSLKDHTAWKKLEAMIGLRSVKTAVKSLMLQLKWNYNRELAELPPVKTSLNRVFLGNPGTGKTTVAKLYAKILADAGVLSSSEVVIKIPANFIGAYIGQSEANTMKILEEARGKVLVIDEAYMLGNTGSHDKVDSFRAAVIDTLVGQVQGDVNEDRCVILLGYRKEMEEMFRNNNPGLARRFPMSSAFEFEDYTEDELRKILELKLSQDGLKASDDAKNVAMEVLNRVRNSATFGNAGEVDILLTQAKERQHSRLVHLEYPTEEALRTLEPSDMDENFDRIDHAGADIRELFSGMVGSESLVERLEGYQKIVKNAKAIGIGDPKDFIPFNFIFRGPPGTGKTTTARKMGKVFHDLGFLATTEIVECSASDLIGKYIGQTAPKTRAVFEKGLGKVLFIDEAYQLVSDHKYSYTSEAVGEMVALLTQERYHNKIVVILAGYDGDMNKLLAANPGLSSRFPQAIDFKNLAPQDCRELLLNSLKPRQVFEETVTSRQDRIDRLFVQLAELPSWGNARDVKTLAKSVMSTALIKGAIDADSVVQEMKEMLLERRKRAQYPG
ncbi:hypothetical protein ABKA04_004734 [Annulohypoxylon sp. FPYF3050]